MDPRPAIAVVAGLLIAAIVGWSAWPDPVIVTADEPARAEPIRRPTPKRPAPTPDAGVPVQLPTAGIPVPAEPADDADHAPGRAFRSDRPKPNSTAGTIVPLPPASAEVWRGRRAAMAQAWEAQSMKAARAHAAAAGWSADDRDAALRILGAMHEDLRQVRLDAESGRIRGPEVRERTASAREAARAALITALGADRTEALAAAMREEVRGGGF